MKIEKMKFITRDYVRANPDKVFLFGDNLIGEGYGGQAGAMRDEPNAVGIPTKRTPSGDDAAFFTDDDFAENVKAINGAVMRALNLWSELTDRFGIGNVSIVIPEDGLGTGLAELPARAPRTFEYLERRLADLEA